MAVSKTFLVNLLPRQPSTATAGISTASKRRFGSGVVLSLSSPRLGSPKFEQKMLGSYPVSPEFEMVWRDRMTAHGGYIQQTISPYQLKFIYPFWHTFPARCWAKFSAYAWPWIWPGVVTFFLISKMHHDAEEDVRDKYWY